MYHAGAFEVLLIAALFTHGTAIITSSGAVTTERILTTMQDAAVTHAMLYPFQLYDLLKSGLVDRDRLPALSAILVGGDPVQPWAISSATEAIPGIEIQQGYGLTESTMATCLDHADSVTHPQSVGRPMPFTDVRVVVVDDSRDAAANEIGEVWLRSPVTTTGYWRNQEATDEAFVDGWCRTGDLGRISADGFIEISGRSKDMIRSGGENIYPAEVESSIAESPWVASVAVVGVPDPAYLEVGCAVIVRAAHSEPDDGSTPTDNEVESLLRVELRTRLAGYKCPKHYVFVESLPVGSSGKLDKKSLRAQYASVGSPPDAGPLSTTDRKEAGLR